MLNKAKDVVFFGFDLNYYIAQSTVYHLLQANKVAIAYETQNSQLAKAFLTDKEEVAILISRTGENRRLIEIAKILKKKKVKMILLSGNRDTTLDKICDEFIYIANVTEYLNMGGVIFSIGCRYVLDVLFGILISYNYKNVESFTKNFETINGKGPSDPNRLW